LADGRAVFLKAVSSSRNQASVQLYRREARIAAELPPSAPVPRLRDAFEVDDWVCLAFEPIDGRNPRLPWRQTELLTILAAIGDLNGALTPTPVATSPVSDYLREDFSAWRTWASAPAPAGRFGGLDPWVRRNLNGLARLEAGWEAAGAGSTLLHCDLRADNILITRDRRVLFVDWPHACVGAAFVDTLLMFPSLAIQGLPDLDELLPRAPTLRAVAAEAVNAVLAALAGYLVRQAAQPADPTLPTLRAFQRAQGEAATAWLRRRTGWP
jgi:Ser/Thr protein kinase RdoA (MazF antagonist)